MLSPSACRPTQTGAIAGVGRSSPPGLSLFSVPSRSFLLGFHDEKAGVRETFLSFIALPITFGIGVEYAVDVTSRYRERASVTDAISSTGGAVALCSWTTIVGYGSLLAAQNRALQGFGALAILGEIACLMSAVIVLPALLVAFRKRNRSAGR